MTHFNYQLHRDGVPQEHYARMTPAEADRTNETQAPYGMTWENPQPLRSTAFDVQSVNGTRQTFASFAAFNAHLEAGGMAEGRKQSVQYINSQSTLRRAA